MFLKNRLDKIDCTQKDVVNRQLLAPAKTKMVGNSHSNSLTCYFIAKKPRRLATSSVVENVEAVTVTRTTGRSIRIHPQLTRILRVTN